MIYQKVKSSELYERLSYFKTLSADSRTFGSDEFYITTKRNLKTYLSSSFMRFRIFFIADCLMVRFCLGVITFFA